jgi:Ca2+-binding RTX toxin-like protein
MAVGFATLSGGDTVSFDLDAAQISAVQSALQNLSAGPGASDVSSVFGSTWQHPTEYNVYNLDGGTSVPFAPGNTDAIVLDSINGSTGTNLSGDYYRAAFWVGNQGNDTFTINAPSQTIVAGDGNNSIYLNSLQHGGGADLIEVGGGHDTIQLYGNGTINTHDFAGGSDSIYMHADFGGGAANFIHVRDGNDTVTFLGNTGTVQAGNGADSINFTSDGQVSVGSGNDTITFAGAGSIYAGNGADKIVTTTNATMYVNVGNGNDSITIHGGNGTVATTIIAGSGDNSLTLGDPTTWGVYNVSLGGGNDTVTVGLGSATITNSGGSTHLDATHSTDLNYTGAGTDVIQLGAGYDSVVENGSATVIGGSILPGGSFVPSATVQGGSGNFVFTGHDGYDSVTAGSGAATLTAGNGNDTFHAGASSNALLDASGSTGNDALYGGSGSATLLGGSGNDSFYGGSGNTSMVGGSGYSVFQGSSGNTTMVGGSNWNFFIGGSGHDTMVANTVPTASGSDPNAFLFDATVGGTHEIDGYNTQVPGGDQAIHLTFTNYGLTASDIVADSQVVGTDTVITIPGAGGNPTTTITIKDYVGIQDWNINSH